jgi:hypothetical protein
MRLRRHHNNKGYAQIKKGRTREFADRMHEKYVEGVNMTDKQLVPMAQQVKIQEAIAFCQTIEKITITDNSEYENAIDLTKRIKEIGKELDQDRLELVKPYKDRAKEIDYTYKAPKDALKNLETRLRKAIGRYQSDLEKKRLEEQRKAAQAALDPHLDTHQAVVEPSVPPPPQEGMHFREKWTAIIKDKTAFVKYCLDNGELHLIEVNIQTLNKLAQSTKGQMNLPGIDFKKENVPVFKE